MILIFLGVIAVSVSEFRYCALRVKQRCQYLASKHKCLILCLDLCLPNPGLTVCSCDIERWLAKDTRVFHHLNLFIFLLGTMPSFFFSLTSKKLHKEKVSESVNASSTEPKTSAISLNPRPSLYYCYLMAPLPFHLILILNCSLKFLQKTVSWMIQTFYLPLHNLTTSIYL